VPEGDTIYRTATTLGRALLGHRLTGFETSLEAVAVVAEDSPVVGRLVGEVEARGKHLLIRLPALEGSGAPGLVLHTHMRMTGAWHLYRPGERWQKPASYAKVVLHTAGWVAPCFSAPVVELLTDREVARHPTLLALGPDAITPEFDPAEAVARVAAQPDTEIAVALLDQRLLAGIGNVYKSEVLFIHRVNPFARVGALEPDLLARLVREAHRLLRLNRAAGVRRTHNSLREDARLWVYGRAGEPCRACGGPIHVRRQGLEARATYFCPACQSVGLRD